MSVIPRPTPTVLPIKRLYAIYPFETSTKCIPQASPNSSLPLAPVR